MNDYLMHYGVSKRDGAKVGSGRYPLGSGKNPKKFKDTDEWKSIEKYKKSLYQNKIYQDEDFVLKKDTKFQRIGSAHEKNNHDRTYVSYTDRDKDTYLADHTDFIGDKKITLKGKRDIKVAGAKARVEALIDTIGDYTPDELLQKSLPKADLSKLKEWYGNAFTDMLKDEESFKRGVRHFEYFIVEKGPVSDTYFSKLKAKGYDALVDNYDRPSYSNPIIVLDRKKSLKTLAVSDITEKDVEEAIERLINKGKSKP